MSYRDYYPAGAADDPNAPYNIDDDLDDEERAEYERAREYALDHYGLEED